MARTYSHTLDGSINFTKNTNPSTTGYTCGAGSGGCTVLLCGIVVAGSTARAGGAPTFAAVTMTQVDTTRKATETGCELWYLLDPVSGSSQTLSIPNTGTARTLYVTLASFSTNDPPILYKSVYEYGTGFTTGGGTSVGSSILVPTTGVSCVVFQIQGCGNNSVPTANSHTLLYKVDRGNYSDDSQYTLQTTPDTVNFTWTFSNDDWCSVAAAFRVGRRAGTFHVN